MANFYFTGTCVLILLAVNSIGFSFGSDVMFLVDQLYGLEILYSKITPDSESETNFTRIELSYSGDPLNIVYDSVTNTLYWVDAIHTGNTIVKFNVAEQNHEVIVSVVNASYYSRSMCIDPIERKIYWTGSQGRTIDYINLNGNEISNLMSIEEGEIIDIRVGVVGNKRYMYMIVDQYIQRVSLDNVFNADILANDTSGQLRGLTLTTRKLYWHSEDTFFREADLDGANIRMIASRYNYIDVMQVYGNYLFVSDGWIAGGIYRIDIDSGEINTYFDGFVGGMFIYVEDNMSPSLMCPDNIDEATTSTQATVIWNDPVVTDNTDTGLSATCTPSSGTSFNAGSTNVTCSAIDAAGNGESCMFVVNVIEDHMSPSLMCPDNIDEATTSTQATVIWNDPVVTDNTDTGLSATCTPSSGTSFNAGSTNVTCSAIDAAGNGESCMFVVNVIEDHMSPSLMCPDNIDEATKSTQATVIWNDPVVTDNIDTSLSATCTPSSGTSFNAGSTNVTCSTIDAAGNGESCMFVVNVIGNCNASSVPGYLITIVVIVCVINLVMSPAYIFLCRFYSQKNKRIEHSTGMNMTDYDDVEVPQTTKNSQDDTGYEITLPAIGDDNAATPPQLESEMVNSAFEDPHTYMSIEPAYTNLQQRY